MVKKIKVVLMIAEPKTGNVALLAREPREKRERIAPHRVKCSVGRKAARCGRLKDCHLNICLAEIFMAVNVCSGTPKENDSCDSQLGPTMN
jgi:hypothetical protein